MPARTLKAILVSKAKRLLIRKFLVFYVMFAFIALILIHVLQRNKNYDDVCFSNVDLKYFLDTSTVSDQAVSLSQDDTCKKELGTFLSAITEEEKMKAYLDLCTESKDKTTTDDCLYSLRIIVLTYDRPESLIRLLNSLDQASYGDDKVKIEVWIDRNETGSFHHRTLIASLAFRFGKGMYEVILRGKHMGPFGQWVSGYKPNIDCAEIVVIFEDNLTVSPYFYAYLKVVHSKYCVVGKINGISLQRHQQTFFDQKLPEEVTVPDGNLVYLYPVIGTMGFSPCTVNWWNFIQWLNYIKYEPCFKPYIPNHFATTLYKTLEMNEQAEQYWTIWHIYYAYIRREYTLHIHFTDREGLIQHWTENGPHDFKGKLNVSNPVIETWELDVNKLPDEPVHVDINGHVMK